MKRILVAGAGGFIGHHLVKRLKAEGNFVRGADIKHPEFEETAADEFVLRDLRHFEDCVSAQGGGLDEVYQLAADMGGIGYITANLASLARNNTLINANMLEAARACGVKRYLYTSSACVYNQSLQASADVLPLKEEDAYPAMAEPGYGWEKLYAELMCEWYMRDFGLDARIVRFHNVYGPLGTWRGGKEKAPAALCRKVAQVVQSGGDTLPIWGDGKQTRSFMHVDDCVEGLLRLMASGYRKPLNLGTDELVSVDGLADIITEIAGATLKYDHDLSAPQGVRGRNSDNTRLRRVLGWEPGTPLAEGLRPTYEWIYGQVKAASWPRETVAGWGSRG